MIITIARKPLEGTVVGNVLKHECGGINIDASRIPSNDGFEKAWDKPVVTNISSGGYGTGSCTTHTVLLATRPVGGRWPANTILSHMPGCQETFSVCLCAEGCPCLDLNQQSGLQKSGVRGVAGASGPALTGMGAKALGTKALGWGPLIWAMVTQAVLPGTSSKYKERQNDGKFTTH